VSLLVFTAMLPPYSQQKNAVIALLAGVVWRSEYVRAIR